MPRTDIGWLRLTPDELQRAQRVMRYVPEVQNQAALNKHLWLLGLALVEAQIAAAGGPLPPRVTEAELATVVLARLHAALPLLMRTGKLGLLSLYPTMDPAEPTQDADHSGSLVIDAGAAEDVRGLGGDDFL